MKIEDLYFTRLNKEKETINFDCGDNDLNEFIRKDAWAYQQELLSVTYLFDDKQGNVLAFFSVSNDLLKDQDFVLMR
jgi:hypothetical protein